MSFRTSGPRRHRWLGSQAFEIEDRPLIANPLDDEFDSNTLDPKWIKQGYWNTTDAPNPSNVFTSGGVRHCVGSPGPEAARPSWLILQPDTDSSTAALATVPNSFTYLEQAIQIPDYCVVYARMAFGHRLAGQAENEACVGFGLYGGGFCRNGVDTLLNESDVNTIQIQGNLWTNGTATSPQGTTNNVGGAGGVEGQHGHTVAIARNGSNFESWVLAATDWIYVGRATYTGVIDTLCLWGRTAVTTNGNAMMGFDFVRCRHGKGFLP